MGSGFVYDEDGRVVTNQHVVDGADTVTVTFADGTERRARVLGSDASTDLAVLEVEDTPASATPLALAGPGSVEVGEVVVAIGSPYGLEGASPPASSARSTATSPRPTGARSPA